jgi:hypothetical protein
MKTTRITRWAASAVAGAAIALVPLALAGSASAAPAVTAHTHITNNPDSGGNGNWSYDNFNRTLTVTPGATAGTYTATIHDTGTWSGIVGNFAPNQGGADHGTKITHSVSGVFSGDASYSFTANTAPSAANVAHVLDDHFASASGKNTTSLWYEQAFTAGTTFGGTGILNTWSWTYNETSPACHQRWTDAFVSGDGQQANDGNITGASCHVVPPHAHSVYTIQASGHVQSEQSHKYLAVVDGKLVQEGLNSSNRFAMVISNVTHLTGLEVLTSHGNLSGEFVTIPDGNGTQATVVNHFVQTSKHGSFYSNGDGNDLNNAAYSLFSGNRQIGWAPVHTANEAYTSPGQ